MREPSRRLSTGIAGLDEILFGGLTPARTYLVSGQPGTGKTILGLHFLGAGAVNGEKALLITLGEAEAQIRKNAETLGLDLTGISFLDLSPSMAFFSEVKTYDIFSAADVEREPTTRKIIEKMEELNPQRILIDSMTQFRYLSPDPFQFRKQVLSFLQFLTSRKGTVLFTSEGTASAPDDDLEFMCDGAIHLVLSDSQRIVRITKFRGSDFLGGDHTMRLTDHGMAISPRLIPESHQKEFVAESISSGVPQLDTLLHGGLERGTISVFTGPSGVGKTTLGVQFMKAAAARGERSVIYLFEEGMETLLHRSALIKVPIQEMIQRGTLSVVQVEPLQFAPDEFASMVRAEVEAQNTRIVMIDGVTGYQLSVRGGDLIRHLHSLCRYLKNMGVTVILINETEEITGDFKATEVGISYLADNLVFLRYLELHGELRKTIGVLKKRLTDFEKTLREIEITGDGVKVGRPLTELRGILRGIPEWVSPPKTQ
ncbi:MAG: AAA family ATPase [Nitrospirae bacterium]|nr:AAA family ATPase [Candidatus Manganitrophaceae bacterium]